MFLIIFLQTTAKNLHFNSLKIKQQRNITKTIIIT